MTLASRIKSGESSIAMIFFSTKIKVIMRPSDFRKLEIWYLSTFAQCNPTLILMIRLHHILSTLNFIFSCIFPHSTSTQKPIKTFVLSNNHYICLNNSQDNGFFSFIVEPLFSQYQTISQRPTKFSSIHFSIKLLCFYCRPFFLQNISNFGNNKQYEVTQNWFSVYRLPSVW